MKEKYTITGMSCSACSSRVQKSVSALPGIKKAEVNLLTNSMQVEYDAAQQNTQNIIDTVTKAGYGAIPMTAPPAAGAASGSASGAAAPGIDVQALLKKEQHAMKVRLIGSLIFWLPLMYVAMYLMMHQMYGWPAPAAIAGFFMGPENALTYTLTQFLLLLPIVYLNRKYFQNGLRSLMHRSPNMDSLVAVGAGTAIVYGIFAMYRLSYGLGHQDMALVEQYIMEVYFESAGTILTLITVGKYLESRSKAQTGKAIEKLVSLAPKTALVEKDGVETEIPAWQVAPGDIVILKPGATVPVDGTILSGSSALDESVITGESIPVEKSVGDTVISASLNKTGSFRMRADKTGDDTTISQIIRLVEEASASKAPIARLADQIAGIFVPTVMTIALAAFLIWLISGATFAFALSIGIAVLVISCPCALGLATPVAIMVGTGKGAENGILIKSGEALEHIHSVDTVVLDKTGTLTNGKPVVTDVIPLKSTGRTELLRTAAMLEKNSEHPLAEAILSYVSQAPERNEESALPQAENFRAVFGRGVTASCEGAEYLAGNELLMQENGISTAALHDTLNRLSEEGRTVLFFARKPDTLLGIIAAADTEKPTSSEAIRQFKKLGVRVVMLTGDNQKTADAIGRRLQIDQVIAGVLPAEKETQVRALQEAGHKVAMVGDGINDAPALARADVGIAIGAGTDVAIESADAVLMKSDLLDAVNAIRLGRSVIRNIKENLFWAFFYNSIGIPLAAGVLYPAFGLKLSPMFGAAAMSLSSVCVVLNALRLNFFKPLTAADAQPASDLQNRQPENIPEIPGKEEKNMNQITVSIEGMMCMHCQKHVTEALNAIDGVSAEVSLESKNAVVTTDREVSDEVLRKAVTDAGYEVTGISR